MCSLFLRKRESPSSEEASWRRHLIQSPFEEGASMRKQNHPIPPAPEHQGRLINPTMRSAKYKRPNALKHGVYATPVLIPGENQKEFEDLLAELLDEYKPRGPSLRHAVHCLADDVASAALEKIGENRAR